MNYKIALSVDLLTTFTYNIANLLNVDIRMFKTAFFGFFSAQSKMLLTSLWTHKNWWIPSLFLHNIHNTFLEQQTETKDEHFNIHLHNSLEKCKQCLNCVKLNPLRQVAASIKMQ